jgi:flavin-dependent dehydrogenase
MKEIREPSRLTPVIAETDVLVVGSGPGGLAAAVSSARAGVPTMLVERYGCLGGNLTHVGVEGIAWYRQEKTVDVEGIGLEFEKRAKNFGAAAPEPQSLSQAINAEMFKIVADTWVQEAGVETLLHALAVGVIRDGDGLKGIIAESKSGRQAILAKRIVDATGDADIAALCGAPYRKTPKEDMLSVTVMFSCSGVDRAVITHAPFG